MLSYQSLEKNLGFEKALPVTEHWSAAPDFLKIISDYCLEKKPQIIVECGSGTSSLILSRCCQLNQTGHVYSLENGEAFVKQTQQQLDDFSLSASCDVFHVPLKEYSLGAETYQWYDFSRLAVSEIEVLIIDGPPGFLQAQSRYPALVLLGDMLAKHCAVYLDDAAREDEQLLVRRWLKLYPEFDNEYIDNARGCSILNR